MQYNYERKLTRPAFACATFALSLLKPSLGSYSTRPVIALIEHKQWCLECCSERPIRPTQAKLTIAESRHRLDRHRESRDTAISQPLMLTLSRRLQHHPDAFNGQWASSTQYGCACMCCCVRQVLMMSSAIVFAAVGAAIWVFAPKGPSQTCVPGQRFQDAC